MYLAGASTLIRHFGGTIRSFDGDRVMGIFVGDSKCNDAVRAAFAIEWMVTQVINPLVHERHTKNNTAVWIARQGIGIDLGEAFIARAGVRNSPGETTHNDLTFIGVAPNVAAKLSALRGADAGPIVITDRVFAKLNPEQKTFLHSEDGVWRSNPYAETVGPYQIKLHRSSYWRSI